MVLNSEFPDCNLIAAANHTTMSHLKLCQESARVGLPEMMASEQVPLTSTFPSGQIHLAPVGLSRHMKSQDILRHGFEAVEKVKTSQDDDLPGWPQMRKKIISSVLF